MLKYPEIVTEHFDDATLHINYCLSFIKKYLGEEILEVGGGCGSFTKIYYDKKIKNLTITEVDKKNLNSLKKYFKKYKNIFITNKKINKINKKFDTIIYLHVLEHIKDDEKEIFEATKKLKKNGHLIFIVPAHPKMYSRLDKLVGHHRRYEINFFKKKFLLLKLLDLRFLDSMGYILYYLNKIFFKKEKYPSKLKIFIWDKIFTPLSFIIDFITQYKFGKCILAIYKKL
jgi:ubiquinone/menaquinone biosynthesis C-methylase UbiE